MTRLALEWKCPELRQALAVVRLVAAFRFLHPRNGRAAEAG
jgi:hypothetical protein